MIYSGRLQANPCPRVRKICAMLDTLAAFLSDLSSVSRAKCFSKPRAGEPCKYKKEGTAEVNRVLWVVRNRQAWSIRPSHGTQAIQSIAGVRSLDRKRVSIGNRRTGSLVRCPSG